MQTAWIALALLAALVAPAPAEAGCGCDKPPPPRAAVRPFVAFANHPITLFGDGVEEGRRYDILFEPLVGGEPQWARGRARLRRDLADGAFRPHLRVTVPDLALGPCRVSAWRDGVRIVDVSSDSFTVTARPISLSDRHASHRRGEYRAGVGADGTLYIPVDVADVSEATRFWGQGFDLPLDFERTNVAMYNDQGFLMQLLDPTVPGLFDLAPAGSDGSSAVLGYWRHEFRTYKAQHRQEEAFEIDDDENWHATGTRHVNHDLIVVAVRGRLLSGALLAPGESPPFTLAILTDPEPR